VSRRGPACEYEVFLAATAVPGFSTKADASHFPLHEAERGKGAYKKRGNEHFQKKIPPRLGGEDRVEEAVLSWLACMRCRNKPGRGLREGPSLYMTVGLRM